MRVDARLKGASSTYPMNEALNSCQLKWTNLNNALWECCVVDNVRCEDTTDNERPGLISFF